MRLLSLPGRWPRVATWAARCKGMSDVAKQRLKAIQFADRHGIAAAADHAGVTGRTIYRWKALLRDGGPDALEIQPRKPRRRPPSRWPPEIVEEIRRLRTDHPNLGKRKIHPLLTRFCQERGLVCPAVVTIGRLIARAGGMRMIPPRLDNRGRRSEPAPDPNSTRWSRVHSTSILAPAIAYDTSSASPEPSESDVICCVLGSVGLR